VIDYPKAEALVLDVILKGCNAVENPFVIVD